MKFRIAQWLYRVRVSQGQLLDADGTALDGLCCWSERTIWISQVLPMQQRIDTLLHELAHAWEQHHGLAPDAESAANRTSAFAAHIWRQLESQGGAWALARLQPDGEIDTAAGPEIPNTNYAVLCGNCQSMIAIGSVVNSQPRYDHGFKCVAVNRCVECEFCGTRQTWLEGATITGKPNGKILAGPTMSALA